MVNRFALIFTIVAALAIPSASFAQESNADYDPSTDDGRLNFNYWMDGFGLYCVDETGQVATTYENGGFQLLREGVEQLYIPAADIEAGIAAAEESGEFAVLGAMPEDSWFYPEPAIYYLPETDEFQINIAKSSIDDLREGKLYTFYWTECRQ